MTSYAQVIQVSETEWKVSGRAFKEILVPTFTDRVVAVQIATAINQAFQDGADELRYDFRTIMGLKRDDDY